MAQGSAGIQLPGRDAALFSADRVPACGLGIRKLVFKAGNPFQESPL
jgi:hypothetical protein